MKLELDDLRHRLVELNDANQQIHARALAETRDLTIEEENEFKSNSDEFRQIESRIEQLSEFQAQTERLNKGTGRRTQPEEPVTLAVSNDSATLTKSGKVPATPLTRNGGFHTLGHFGQAVANACLNGGKTDARLERLAAATTYGNEQSGPDGGFAVPPDFRNEIMQKVLGEDSLLSRCDQITTIGNNVTFPKDESAPWAATGGIQAYWDGEASAATQSKPKLTSLNVKLNKLRCLVPMTEELLEDASAMDAYLRRKAPEVIGFKVNLAIIQGNGSGMPLGILNSPCLVSQAQEAGQQSDTLVAMNVINMYSRLYAPLRAGAVWLINQDLEPQLLKLSLPGTDNTGNFVTGWGGLIYTPANGLSGSPYGTLFGRPVIPTQACETLGDKGDIIFAHMPSYLALLKSGPNPRIETSMHLWFDQDLMAFKFVLRMGGQPWWESVVSARDGNKTYSPFVTLDERAGGG